MTLVHEYRSSMDADVLHSWAKDAVARIAELEAERDDWKAMYRHAQQTIADLNGDLKGQRARAEKAEALLKFYVNEENWQFRKQDQ